VFGDSQRLKVMLLNLLDNAIRYTPDGGKVTLALTALEDCIELRVEDNGVGIPENEHDMIFERFHRVLDNSQEGSGLGLSIVKEIVILHGADIAVASAGKGAGTIMTVRFNRKVKPSEPQHVA
jgi:two-component system, OmpR family, sensor histidine kinase TctE